MEAAIRTSRRFLLSLAALAVVLPAAIVFHTKGSIVELLTENSRLPVEVDRGSSQSFAGADWRLTGLTRLPGIFPGSTTILAEFEAIPRDMQALRAAIGCKVLLQDDRGRQWEPVFITERSVREARPDAAEKPRCLSFAESENGRAMNMAEVFLAPEDATGLTLSISAVATFPDTLLFR